MIQGLYRYRSFIWANALAELRHRYAGTNLGVVWNVIHPLALIAVYAIVFTQVFTEAGRLPQPIPGVSNKLSFLLFLTSAFLPWLAFAECVTRGCNAFSDNAPYLKKLPIPEQVFVAQTAASATLGLVISFSLLLGISLLAGLQTISPSLYEAALLDGSTGWQRFRYITFPLLLPILAIVMTFSIIFTFTDFQLVYAITRGGPVNSTHLMATLAFQRGIAGQELAEGAAIAVAMIPFLVFATLFSYFALARRKWQQGEGND